jgi:hypothetical protein
LRKRWLALILVLVIGGGIIFSNFSRGEDIFYPINEIFKTMNIGSTRLAAGEIETVPIVDSKSTTTYTYNSMTDCVGKTCTVAIGGSYAFDSDGKWKSIDQAYSLKDSNVKCNVNSDGKDIAECLDWNTTSITLNLSQPKSTTSSLVPLKIWSNGTVKNSSSILFTSSKDIKTMTIPISSLSDSIEFGQSSTTITLNESNKGNVGDTYTYNATTSTQGFNYGTHAFFMAGKGVRYGWILWNLSAIPAGSTITNANLTLYTQCSFAGGAIGAYNTSTYTVNDCGRMWVEGTVDGDNNATCNELIWKNQPPAGTLQDIQNPSSSGKWYGWNVTNAANSAFASNTNMSISLQNNSATDYGCFYSKEYTTDTTKRPQLVVTYTAGGDTTPPTYNNNGTNNTNPNPLDQVLYYTKWADDVALSHWIFSWNATGVTCSDGFANDTAVAFSGGTWSNVTKQAPLACAGKVIDFLFYANDTSNNWNKTVDENEAADTCTYTSGDWNVDCSDNCLLSADTDIGANTLTFSGTGIVTINANIVANNIIKDPACKLVKSGGSLIW